MVGLRSLSVAALAGVACSGGVAACGGAEPGPATSAATTAAAPPARTAPRRPAICGRVDVKVMGKVGAPEATELSGLVRSPSQPGVLWAHNDSGDRARIFALRTDGSVIASLDVPGADAVDWEDIEAGPGDSLLLADIGDNRSERDGVDVYRVPEPRLSPAAAATAPAERLALKYPDGAHDAETLLADPRTGEIVIVTKRFDGRSGVYAGRWRAGEETLRKAGVVSLGIGGLATAGDVSGNGRVVAVRTYSEVYGWARRPGTSIASTLRHTPCVGTAPLLREGQGESLALSRDGRSFFTVPEGAGATLRRYAAAGAGAGAAR